MHRSLAVLALAACSHKAEPAPSTIGSGSALPVVVPVAVIDAAAPLPTCIVRDNVDAVAVTPTTVEFCVGQGALRSCWHVDVATKKIEARGSVKEVAATPQASMTGNPDGTLTICTATKQCSTAKPTFSPSETDVLAINADATILARIPDSKLLELYDTATWKRLASIAPWKSEMGAFLATATFAGPNIIVFEHASPVSSQGKIFTLGGKLVGTIGDQGFTQDESASWQADGTTWLFKQIDSTRLIAVDVATGKQLKDYNLAPMAADTTDENVTAAGVAANADTIVYLSGSGVVGVIARATGTVEVLSPPVCTQ